jgi:hypothetical protein
MLARRLAVLLLVVLLAFPASAKSKKKNLPDYVLAARTVLVLVDPDAGISVSDPNENRMAQDEVEKALTAWGRLSPVMDAQTADLIITVRRGHGRVVNPTIGNVPNDRPVILQPNDSGIRLGAQQGRSSPVSDPTINPQGPYPRTEVGATEDTFIVYQAGGVVHPLEHSPAWRYTSKDALAAPSVPAVTEFRKAIDEAEKQKQSQKQQKP